MSDIAASWLNYHHLYYFSIIAEEGGVAAAARRLRLSHSTLSAQLRALEEQLGAPLFERRGKRLVPTAFGVDAAAYAGDIFKLGRELVEVARGRAGTSRRALRVGVVSSMPKTLAARLVSPALAREEDAAVLIQDGAPALLDALAGGRLHVVLMNDTPLAPPGVKLHTHRLGQTDILLFGTAALARRMKGAAPAGLRSLPFVLPTAAAPLRRGLDAWFAKHRISVRVKAEADDAGLLRALGAAGRGVFPVRAALRAEVDDLGGVREICRCDGVHESHVAITTDRRVRHPGVSAIIEGARADLDA